MRKPITIWQALSLAPKIVGIIVEVSDELRSARADGRISRDEAKRIVDAAIPRIRPLLIDAIETR